MEIQSHELRRMDTQEDMPLPLLEENNDDIIQDCLLGEHILYTTNIPEMPTKTTSYGR
jgi:hypothetical protein